MFLASLVRIAGVIAFLVFTLGAFIALSAQSFAMMAICASLAVGGLAAAIGGDKALKRNRDARDAAVGNSTAPFTAGALTVGVRWVKWAGFVLLAGAFAAGMLVLAPAMWSGGKRVAPAFLVMGGLMFGVFSLSFLRLGWRAMQAGYLLHMDMLGFAHAQLAVLPWRHVVGIDLQETTVKQQKNWILKLALEPAYFDAIRPPAWQRWVDLPMPKFDGERKIVSVGLPFISVTPGELLAAARAIADRAGAPRIRDWVHYEDVPTALARRDAQLRADSAQQEIDALLTKLKMMDRQKMEDPQEIKRIDARLAQSFERMSTANDQTLQAHRSTFDKQNRAFKKAVRAFYIVFGIGVAFVILKVLARWL